MKVGRESRLDNNFCIIMSVKNDRNHYEPQDDNDVELLVCSLLFCDKP